MEGYAVYWDSKGHLFTEKPKETYGDSFRNGIPKKDVLPDGYEYCKLQLIIYHIAFGILCNSLL